MAKKRKDIGKGLNALFSGMNKDIEVDKQSVVNRLANTVANIPIKQIETNPYQPRIDFDQEALQELSISITTHGLVQPITVRHLPPDRFQVISGERRLRATKLTGATEIMAYVRLANDQEMHEMALIENIQREDLNAMEIAITYSRLMEECKLTQEQLSERLGKGRSTIANYLGLLKLMPKIQQGLRDGNISMGHAKALAGITDIAFQVALYGEIIEKGLSVRQTEAYVRAQKDSKSSSPSKTKKPKLSLAHQRVQLRLRDFLNTKVQLKCNEEGKGEIHIAFENNDDLNRILELLENDEDD